MNNNDKDAVYNLENGFKLKVAEWRGYVHRALADIDLKFDSQKNDLGKLKDDIDKRFDILYEKIDVLNTKVSHMQMKIVGLSATIAVIVTILANTLRFLFVN